MKNIFFLSIAILVAACGSSKEATRIPSAQIADFTQTITAEGLKADLAVLAHDSLEGRDTGSEGLEKAARYLKMRYRELGIKSPEGADEYEQYFDVISPVVNGYSYELKDKAGNPVSSTTFNREQTADFITVFGGTSPRNGEIVFAGYGAVNPASRIDHLPENAEGKWLLVFLEQNVTNIGAIQAKVNQDNAAGVLLITVPVSGKNYNARAEQSRSALGRPGRMTLKYLDEGTPREVAAWSRIRPELAATILGLSGAEELSNLSSQLKENPGSFTSRELEYSLSHQPDIDQRTITTSNVVALIEGEDPELKDEVVVLSAHYDHIGIGAPDSTGDAIYNGADDDGSGTAALLNVAQAMVAAKNAGAGPKRSVMFLHVSGEEKGLLGSRYYSDHPLMPIDKTVANINVDMIGRVDPEHEENKNYVYVIGGEIISSGLDSLMNRANDMSVNLDLSKRYNDLKDPQQFYRRSDHWNFGRLGVPFVFFFNGVHEDYHRPSDHIEKIEWDPLTKRTQLIYMTTALLANSDERPVVDNQEFIEVTKANSR